MIIFYYYVQTLISFFTLSYLTIKNFTSQVKSNSQNSSVSKKTVWSQSKRLQNGF